MRRGATANVLFTFPETVNLTAVNTILLYVYGTETRKTLIKNDPIIVDPYRLRYHFTQEETLAFYDNEIIELQFHWKVSETEVHTSDIIKTDMYRFLGDKNNGGGGAI